MKRTVISAILIIAILLGVIAAIIISQEKDPGKTGEGKTDKTIITRGPYLQIPADFTNSNRIFLSWETSRPHATLLSWSTRGPEHLTKEKTPKTRHRVELPSSILKYGILSPESEPAVITTGSFQVQVEPGKSMKFVVYGDSRYQPKEHAKVCKAIQNEKPAFIIHTGDFVTDGRISSQWDTEWFGPAKEMLKSIPVLPVLGNHEYNAAEYYKIFDVTTGGAQDYARITGDVEIIVIDTNRDFIPGAPSKNIPTSANYKWLKEKLEAPRKTKWRIVCMHNPAFSSGKHGSSDNVLYALVPLFSKYKPDVVFCGHDHCYERSEYEGITYVTTAGGGAPLYKKSKKNPFSKVYKAEYHHTLVETDGDKMTITARKPDGTVIDTLTIIE